ncbi:hypothetical protein HDU97_002836 [Phlyctochytrium planicorne]|nr:hypothetical protein HDU97_002836 [Phlyctochytrium planicorne]
MHLSKVLATVAAIAISTAQAQTHLSPPDGQLYLGAWYERMEGDLASQVNARIKGIPGAGLSFFQTDIDISLGKDPRTAPNITDSYLQQLEDTGTDTFAYLTVYPFLGFDGVTDAQLNDLAQRIVKIISRGRKVFLRLYPEMNGSWFNYGQDPAGFIKAWKRAVDTINNQIGASHRDYIAYVWAPNSGNGYPYPNGVSSPKDSSDSRFKLLDTNNDGQYNNQDNPYSPFYPGDDYVDWVGLSIYHYGTSYPWVQNQIPESNKFEGLMQGFADVNPEWGNTPFYTQFSSPTGLTGVTKGNKPFMLAEGGATYHFGWSDLGKSNGRTGTPDLTAVSRVDLKRAWWNQFLSKSFLQKYPNFKAACTFEFIKAEEETLRDFTNFGMPPPNATAENKDADLVAAAFVADAKTMDFIKWATTMTAIPTSTITPDTTGAPTPSASNSASVTASKPSGAGSSMSGEKQMMAMMVGIVGAIVGTFFLA